MKKLRNQSQLKEQKNSPKTVNNETDLCTWTDIEYETEIVKILKELGLNIKELREDVKSNGDSFRKELENIRRNIEKLENSGSSCCGAAEASPTRNQEVSGLIPGHAQWVKNLTLPLAVL